MSEPEWWRQDFYVYDVESTGVRVRRDRIVTATLLHLFPDGRHEALEWLADPGVEIPQAASDIHGVTTERARDEGRPAVEVIAEIAEALKEVFASGKALVIYNAPFDTTMTGCEILRHFDDPSFEVPECVVDPLVIDKRLNPKVRGAGARKLVNTCKRNGIVLSEKDAHTSAGDTMAAGRLAYRQVSGSTLLAPLPLDELHRRQKPWFRGQKLSLASWLDTKDAADAQQCRVEAESWPMHPLALEPFFEPVTESGGEAPF